MITDHAYVVHKNCEIDNCLICDGGLSNCTVCGGAEGSLPIHCPAILMTQEQSDQVYARTLDFYEGAWVKK
jgi:hypothetical protein